MFMQVYMHAYIMCCMHDSNRHTCAYFTCTSEHTRTYIHIYEHMLTTSSCVWVQPHSYMLMSTTHNTSRCIYIHNTYAHCLVENIHVRKYILWHVCKYIHVHTQTYIVHWSLGLYTCTYKHIDQSICTLLTVETNACIVHTSYIC